MTWPTIRYINRSIDRWMDIIQMTTDRCRWPILALQCILICRWKKNKEFPCAFIFYSLVHVYIYIYDGSTHSLLLDYTNHSSQSFFFSVGNFGSPRLSTSSGTCGWITYTRVGSFGSTTAFATNSGGLLLVYRTLSLSSHA